MEKFKTRKFFKNPTSHHPGENNALILSLLDISLLNINAWIYINTIILCILFYNWILSVKKNLSALSTERRYVTLFDSHTVFVHTDLLYIFSLYSNCDDNRT